VRRRTNWQPCFGLPVGTGPTQKAIRLGISMPPRNYWNCLCLRIAPFTTFLASPSFIICLGYDCRCKEERCCYRAAVSNKPCLLMDRRATFANPETNGSFTLYADTIRNEVRYRSLHKCIGMLRNVLRQVLSVCAVR
jgi:hypothetical protein